MTTRSERFSAMLVGAVIASWVFMAALYYWTGMDSLRQVAKALGEIKA